MASSLIHLPIFPGSSSLDTSKSTFLGVKTPPVPNFSTRHGGPISRPRQVCARFDVWKLMGGRGLCNGEKGLAQELQRGTVLDSGAGRGASEKTSSTPSSSPPLTPSSIGSDNAFEKELLGMTGGFPGGEKGLQKFLEENPPPAPASASTPGALAGGSKPNAPTLPLLMPGMIVIVKNPENPYYMYCGIVQRITDGKAGVLFEGGNWDKLLTFPLSDLERRDKGPPMVNPKSAVLEPLLQKDVASN